MMLALRTAMGFSLSFLSCELTIHRAIGPLDTYSEGIVARILAYTHISNTQGELSMGSRQESMEV